LGYLITVLNKFHDKVDVAESAPQKRGRGRPLGSKNKPKGVSNMQDNPEDSANFLRPPPSKRFRVGGSGDNSADSERQFTGGVI
jgi:hypothetical protein